MKTSRVTETSLASKPVPESSQALPAPKPADDLEQLHSDQASSIEESAAQARRRTEQEQRDTFHTNLGEQVAARHEDLDAYVGEGSATVAAAAKRMAMARGDVEEMLDAATPQEKVSAVERAADGGVTTKIDGRAVSTTATAQGPSGREESASFEWDRYGLSISGVSRDDSSELFANIYTMEGYLSASAGKVNERDGIAVAKSMGVSYTPQGPGLSGRVSMRQLSGDILSLGGMVNGTAHREVVDLGPYTGDDPELMGKRAVEMRRDTGWLAGVLPGWHTGVILGVGGGISFADSRQVRYRTHVEPSRARKLLFEEGGTLVRAIRDRARALGWQNEPLPPPDLRDPLSLKVHDTLSFSVTGAFSGGLVLGPGFGTYIGVQGSIVGDFDLAIERPERDVLQVTIVPTRVTTLQVSGRALAIDAMWSRSKARSMAQRFRFDLREPTALAAYKEVLQGQVPAGALQQLIGAGRTRPRGVTEVLPPGVTRAPLEQLKSKATHAHASVGFWRALLGVTRNASRTTHEIVDGDKQLHERIRVLEHTRTIPFSGDETRGVRSSLVTVASPDDAGGAGRFLRLDLLAYLVDTKARGFEVNRDLRFINKVFGTALRPFNVKSLKKSRAIELRASLDALKLTALSERPRGELVEAAEAAGADASALVEVARRVQETADAGEHAMLVQDFVTKQGIEGMGALIRLLGSDQVKVSTSIGALGDFLERADLLRFKFEEPVHVDMPMSDLSVRFFEIEEALKDLLALKTLIADDPLLDDAERARAHARIADAIEGLRDCERLEHLSYADLTSLIHRMQDANAVAGSGWVSLGALFRAREECLHNAGHRFRIREPSDES